MKYVLYTGNGGDMLFTKEENVKAKPELLNPFVNKTPVLVVEAEDDNEAVTKLNEYMTSKGNQGV